MKQNSTRSSGQPKHGSQPMPVRQLARQMVKRRWDQESKSQQPQK